MKRLCLLLLLSSLLAPASLALEDTDAVSGPEAGQPTQLANELDQFVRDAIDEGLLTPTGEAEPEMDNSMAQDSLPTGVRMRQAAPFPVEVDCEGPYPLDFDAFERFDRYQQIYTFQENVSGLPGEAAGLDGIQLAKAYLALGLYSESGMVLKSASGPVAAAYRKVASLMENRSAADVDYFRKLAECRPEAGVWLGAALLANDQDAGVQTFSENLNGFRKLPFRLRADLAAIVVPQLDKRGERILPVKLLADFTPEQVEEASQLQFVKAIIDLGENRPDADKSVRAFLSEPLFQEQALAVLMRHNKPLSELHEEILLGELMKKFGQTGNDRELAASLQYALQELSGSSHYQPILELSGMPALQNPAAQKEIRRQFIGGLERDLASDNRLRNLAAINALVSDPGILEAAPERTQLYRSGASLAVRFGLVSLTRVLMRRDEADDEVIAELAGLEFRSGDFDAVTNWAQAYPDNAPLNLLAAESAIRKGDAAGLHVYEQRLDLKPETVLALIELDAASGRWLVSDAIYDAAARLTDPVQKQRAERVFAMRETAKDLAMPVRPKVAMAKVASVLGKSDLSSEQVTGGAH
ncbi:hypothetical protein [Hyphomonas adhaerens]|mgnify:FL=1|uniref:Uncharacterized protein n=1 Tax=Hyphomonas adhaerens TaxID=81029 RepID=A0A3B9H3G7_9PROT|nr:hypothetical protein [Hyphomonas adhaerens]HAE29230.1 hypothetical protein [Hyphomonas adhaerens]|tara:strand:- start:944 stop:2698 length:1755 start_codon:yes stop_codon:yes gene_type:complete